ncbi:MAG: antitoxin [Acidobacteriota bacterium]
MRTTLTIDEKVMERLKKVAAQSRLSFKEVVNRALWNGLERMQPGSARRRFRCRTYSMGFPPASNLDKALQLAGSLEDEEVVQKLRMRK